MEPELVKTFRFLLTLHSADDCGCSCVSTSLGKAPQVEAHSLATCLRGATSSNAIHAIFKRGARGVPKVAVGVTWYV